MSLAVVASGAFMPTLSVNAQTTAPKEPAKKISLRDVSKELYGKKKNIPATEIFSLKDSVRPYDANRHIEMLSYYNVNYQPNARRRSICTNTKTGESDTLEIGMAVWDKDNGYKGVFTYDAKNDVIDVHNFGMCAENKKEWRIAAGAIFGVRPSSSKVAIDYAEKGFADMQSRFPQINKEKTHLRFMGFSMGGDAAIQGAFGMALKGYKIDQVVLIDPYAAAYGRRQVKHLVKGEENKKALQEFVAQRCMTMTPIGGSFINKIPSPIPLAKDFGRVEKVDAGAKGEHHFISHYYNKYTPYRALENK